MIVNERDPGCRCGDLLVNGVFKLGRLRPFTYVTGGSAEQAGVTIEYNTRVKQAELTVS